MLPQPSGRDRNTKAKCLASKVVNGTTYSLMEWSNADRVTMWYNVRMVSTGAPTTVGGKSFAVLAEAEALYAGIR